MKDLALHQLREKARKRSQKATVSPVEQSIISIQQYFLTPGMHCISVPTVQQGRSLLRICLDSLQVFGTIALLTKATQPCPVAYHDLLKALRKEHALTTHDGALEEFMLTSFYHDFLIIEYTQELISQPWFGTFEKLLTKYGLHQSIPIIMFMYDEQALEIN